MGGILRHGEKSMNQTSSIIEEGKGKGTSPSCPTCNAQMKEEKTTITFYDSINIDASQYVCVNGHTLLSVSETDRIRRKLKEKERRMKITCAGKILLFVFASTGIFLFGCWVALIILPSHPGMALLAGGGLLILFMFFGLDIFKDFNMYYWAKQKKKIN